MGKTIYLSPSNQYNKTCIDKVTEKMLMEPIAKALISELKKYDCNPVYPTVFDKNGSYTGRPEEAKKVGADVYIAIHSNSSGVIGAYATGCVGYYHGSDELSKRLTRSIQQRLDAACSIKSNRANSFIDGMQVFNGYGYGELREPKKLKITPVLIETNFHSYEPTCRYLYNNPKEIAHEMAISIVEVLGLKPKKDQTIPTQTDEEKKGDSGTGKSDGKTDNKADDKNGSKNDGKQDEKQDISGLAVGDTVLFVGKEHHTASYKGAAAHPAKPGRATVTRVIKTPQKDQIYPIHLIADKSGDSSVYGWVAPSDIKAEKKPESETRAFKVGDTVKIKKEALVYYPGGSTIPDWVKNDFIHIITQTESKGKPVIKGGRACVLLGKKQSVKGGIVLTGINTWVDITNLTK